MTKTDGRLNRGIIRFEAFNKAIKSDPGRLIWPRGELIDKINMFIHKKYYKISSGQEFGGVLQKQGAYKVFRNSTGEYIFVRRGNENDIIAFKYCTNARIDKMIFKPIRKKMSSRIIVR